MNKKIPGYPRYEVNEKGEIWNIEKGMKLKPLKKRTGYEEVCLYNDKGSKDFLIHRLVAMAFIPNPEGKKEINHIDGDKSNNHISNLEWATRSENLKHAFENGLKKQDTSAKEIKARNMLTGEVLYFESIYKAARALKISQGNICMACQNKRPYAGGYVWSYV